MRDLAEARGFEELLPASVIEEAAVTSARKTFAPVAEWIRADDDAGWTESRVKLAEDARAKLGEYVGDTAWTRANRSDAQALRRAETLVKAPPKE